VLFQLQAHELTVLLVQRANEPFKGEWALPGGYNAAGDTTRQALARILASKTGIALDDLPSVEQLYTFDTIARDPRGHAVSVSYLALSRNIEPRVSATTHNPRFYAISKLPRLAYDHAAIIEYAVGRLRSRINAPGTLSALLPEQFTLTQLQTAYEAIVGHPLDKRNFRKKLLSLELLQPTGSYTADGAHRPAMRYAFKEQTTPAQHQ
jgi:8-oxo-dGTP diphosphatase